MTFDSLENEIRQATQRLFETARSLTWNKISDDYKFILTEITSTCENFHEQRKMNKLVNESKVPMSIHELMVAIRDLYHDFYDINLVIYKSTKTLTIIDFRYYPKSSLEQDFRVKVKDNPPMLHCKIAYPPWLRDKKEKFDINWELYEGLSWFRSSWLRFKLRTRMLLV